MAVHKVSSWVWVMIGAVLGLGYDQLQRMPRASWAETYGRSIEQRDFEAGVRDGRSGRRFRNLVIYTESVADPDGGSKRLDLVVGDYATAVSMRDGKPQPARWERRCYVAEAPYRPGGAIAGARGAAGAAGGSGASGTMAAGAAAPAPLPNVMAYLDALR